MKKNFLMLSFLLGGLLYAQKSQEKDSVVRLQEIVVKGDIKKVTENLFQIDTSVEEYLQSVQNVNLIRRGAYAFEPILNNMFSERSVVTIDGMRVFGACTDKMDPVTSYVEMHNLSSITVHSGQEGSHLGSTIGGAIDLKQRKVQFSDKKHWKSSLQAGIESNNFQRFWLGSTAFSSKRIGVDVSASYRKSDNYRDGNQDIVKYSQYEKINTSINVGAKLASNQLLSGNMIYDEARNIGYPALPMDVALARALISMVTYKYFFDNQLLEEFETKLYYNHIAHEMDDSFREEGDKLPIKMDMPGRSETFGGISKIRWRKGNFLQNIQLNVFQNTSTAEMKMYYREGGTMFTYTWPKVATTNGNLSLENQYKVSDNKMIILGASFGLQNNYVRSDIGYNLNQVFHQFDRSKNRFLCSVYGSYDMQISDWKISTRIGYGQRAPSVSEAYGFYLFNNSDGYDYIGNPNLKNETAFEGNLSLHYEKEKWKIHTNVSLFHIKDYIFGQPFGEVAWQMTPLGVQKRGLKMYEALQYARQLNASLSVNYKISNHWSWRNNVGYAYGEDYQGNTLPFIRPLYYVSSVAFGRGNFSSEISVNGDLAQNQFSIAYGEDPTPAYTLVNISSKYGLKIKGHTLDIQLSVENILNRYYTTYADWKNFPRMGRNIILGIKYQF